jgi:hypothetical protein
MDPLDPNRSFLKQLTEPDPLYTAPFPYTQPQLFASQQSNKVANQLVAPCDYLQVQRETSTADQFRQTREYLCPSKRPDVLIYHTDCSKQHLYASIESAEIFLRVRHG